MGRQRVEHWPTAHIFWGAVECDRHPLQRFRQSHRHPLPSQVIPRHRLDQAMDAELRSIRGTRDEGKGFQLREGLGGLALIGRQAWYLHLQQAFGDGVGGEPGEAFEQRPGGLLELGEGGLPGGGDAGGVVHQAWVVPLEHGLLLLAPLFEVLAEAEALPGDVGAGLFEGEGQVVELCGEGGGRGGGVRVGSALVFGAQQQEAGGGLGGGACPLPGSGCRRSIG